MAFPGLQHLGKSPTKKFVDELFVATFSNTEVVGDIASALQISEDEARQVVISIRSLIQKYLLEYNPTSPTNIKLASFLPGDFQANLRDLIEKILLHHMGEWRDAAIATQPSLPKMISMDYRIDIKSASEAISRMSVPTVLIDLKVATPSTNINEEPTPRNVIFELNKETRFLSFVLFDYDRNRWGNFFFAIPCEQNGST